MARKEDWKKIDEFTTDVRRPTGTRKSTQKTYIQESSGKYLALVVMPRRPNFVSYGRVEINGIPQFEGSKQEAEKYAYEYMNN